MSRIPTPATIEAAPQRLRAWAGTRVKAELPAPSGASKWAVSSELGSGA
jgi:hypothetical protein